MNDEVRKGSLLVIFLTVFIDLLGFGLVLPLLPVYARDFADHQVLPTYVLIALLMASFSAMQFLFAPMWGRLSDRIGRRPVLMIGLAGSAVFYAIFGFATAARSLAWLFVSRIGAGIAGATISTAHAYIADSTTLKNRAHGMALVGAAFGLGFTFGPLIGYLAVRGGGPPSSLPGMIAAGLSMFALVLAFFKLPESLDPDRTPQERKLFDMRSLVTALAMPSVGMLLFASFVTVLSFANFESILSLFMKEGGFEFDDYEICLAFAYIGFVLLVVQGGVVRPLAKRTSEVVLASIGAGLQITGFLMVARAESLQCFTLLLIALSIVVAGFGFLTPSLNALISRRSDPAKQGGILGVAQSLSSLARIVGPVVGLGLFPLNHSYPLWLGAGIMVLGLLLVVVAARRGKDFVPAQA